MFLFILHQITHATREGPVLEMPRNSTRPHPQAPLTYQIAFITNKINNLLHQEDG